MAITAIGNSGDDCLAGEKRGGEPVNVTPPTGSGSDEGREGPSAASGGADEAPSPGISPNRRVIKESFAFIESSAQRFTASFHGRLFAGKPQLRGMFPPSMSAHREQVFRAITRIVLSLDSPQDLDGFLAELGRSHRKFGVIEQHHGPFGDAFMDTISAFLGDAWTPTVREAWQAALDHASKVMITAANDDARTAPPWWLAEVVAHSKRGPDVAVLSVRPHLTLPYRAGQYVSVQSACWPREWRTFSIANAPRDDGILQFHVRAVPAGWVSSALVHRTQPGDTLLLGPATGTMVAEPESGSAVLCVAGGTGLAPIKAIVQQLLAAGQHRTPGSIDLFFGARTAPALYDLPALQNMAAAHSVLRVTPVVSEDTRFDGLRGRLPDVVARYQPWQDHEVYISGPPGMVRETIETLTALGIPLSRVHNDPIEPNA